MQITPHIASITNPEAGVGQILDNATAVQKGEALQHTVNSKEGLLIKGALPRWA